MATDFIDIQTILMTIWKTDNSEFSLPTQYENREYQPTKGTAWARLTITPADTYIATLGSGGEDEHIGLMTIDLFYPHDKGNGAALTKADAIRTVFKAGYRTSSGGASLQVLSCRRSGGRVEDGWYRVTVTVEWRARTNRPT